jgi:hypothetical protein
MAKLRPAVALVVLLVAGPPTAGARVLLTVDEALALAFPDAELERRSIYLTAEQLARAAELAGESGARPIVLRHEARRSGELVGTAYFDTHLVRTLAATVMVVVDPDGRVARVETIAFDEPPDYLPRDAWYRQFDGRPLDAELDLRRAIRPVSGATLTARATTAAVRRVLALHAVAPVRRSAPAAAP